MIWLRFLIVINLGFWLGIFLGYRYLYPPPEEPKNLDVGMCWAYTPPSTQLFEHHAPILTNCNEAGLWLERPNQ